MYGFKNMVSENLRWKIDHFCGTKFLKLIFLQTQETIWVTAAEALTHIIKQIIEFAKMVPGFMRFNQDDQIVLLKKGK